jgi:L-rhamnose isomerase
MEEAKSLPWPAVWEYYCTTKNIPAGGEWLNQVRRYEAEVQRKRA